MTKKKAIIYLIIFIVLVTTVQVWKVNFLQSDEKNLPEPCKMVVSTSCQAYINQAVEEKKYEEVVKIKQIRIRENEKLLKFFKSKITNKCLLQMDEKEAAASLYACIDTTKGKNDYYLLKTADFTIRDIILDSFDVAQIQYTEFKDKKAAQKTLKKTQKLINQNKYIIKRDKILEVVNNALSNIK